MCKDKDSSDYFQKFLENRVMSVNSSTLPRSMKALKNHLAPMGRNAYVP